jgi:hypothetical protein
MQSVDTHRCTYVSDTDKQHIIHDDLVPMIRRDVQGFISSRRTLRRLSNGLEFSAKLLVMIGACLAFVATQTADARFVMVTGLLNVTSISTFSLSSYVRKESSERTIQLNRTLETIGISPIPNVTEAINS